MDKINLVKLEAPNTDKARKEIAEEVLKTQKGIFIYWDDEVENVRYSHLNISRYEMIAFLTLVKDSISVELRSA